MTLIPKDFIKGAVIGIVFVSSYFFYLELLNMFTDNRTIQIVAALVGGFSAGLFSYIYEKKRVREEKITIKYHEHRNALVQIEHDLIESRVLIARNISSIEDALQVTDRYRLILRFFPIFLSKGLNLKILNLDLINKYFQLLSQLELINSDFEYIKGLVSQIREVLQSPELQNSNSYSQFVMQSLVDSYILLITNTHKLCILADKDIADLIAMCRIAMNQDSESLIREYIKVPKQINYDFSKKEIEKIKLRIHEEETRPGTDADPRPQFVAPFMDVLKIIVPTPVPQSR